MPQGQAKNPKTKGDSLSKEQIKILKSIELEIKKSSLFLKKNIKDEKSKKVESEELDDTPLNDIKDAIIKTSGDFSKSFLKVAKEINKNILTLITNTEKKYKDTTSTEIAKVTPEVSEEQATLENQKLELVKKQTTTLQDIKDILENKFSGGGGGSTKGGGIKDMLGGITSLIGASSFGGIMATILGIVGAGATALLTSAVAGGLGYAAFKLLLEPMMDEAQKKKNKVFAEKENATIKDIVTDTGEKVYNVDGDSPDTSTVMTSAEIKKELENPTITGKRKVQLEKAQNSESLKYKIDNTTGIQTGGSMDLGPNGSTIEDMRENSKNDTAARIANPEAYAYKTIYDKIAIWDESSRKKWRDLRTNPETKDDDAILKTNWGILQSGAKQLLDQIGSKANHFTKEQQQQLYNMSDPLVFMGNSGGEFGYRSTDIHMGILDGDTYNQKQSESVKTRLSQLQDMAKANYGNVETKKPANNIENTPISPVSSESITEPSPSVEPMLKTNENVPHKNEAIYEGSPEGSKVIVGEDNASEVILSTNANKVTRQIAKNLHQSMDNSDTSSTEKSATIILDALQNSLAEYVEMFKISPLQGNQQPTQIVNNTVVGGGETGNGSNGQYFNSMMTTSNSENILQELLKNSYRAALL